MTGRTIRTTVRFPAPFLLPGLDALQPSGEYRVDLDEEVMEVDLRIAWKRVGVFVHLPAIGVKAHTTQMVPISPADFAALEKDCQQS